jgi:hypothetical protein
MMNNRYRALIVKAYILYQTQGAYLEEYAASLDLKQAWCFHILCGNTTIHFLTRSLRPNAKN